MRTLNADTHNSITFEAYIDQANRLYSEIGLYSLLLGTTLGGDSTRGITVEAATRRAACLATRNGVGWQDSGKNYSQHEDFSLGQWRAAASPTGMGLFLPSEAAAYDRDNALEHLENYSTMAVGSFVLYRVFCHCVISWFSLNLHDLTKRMWDTDRETITASKAAMESEAERKSWQIFRANDEEEDMRKAVASSQELNSQAGTLFKAYAHYASSYLDFDFNNDPALYHLQTKFHDAMRVNKENMDARVRTTIDDCVKITELESQVRQRKVDEQTLVAQSRAERFQVLMAGGASVVILPSLALGIMEWYNLNPSEGVHWLRWIILASLVLVSVVINGLIYEPRLLPKPMRRLGKKKE
ncbi:MAG: hypothetical protein Q3972_06450 [Corynebacterium sp.]|nr:hypothetical protein [Corynebacterium sp.]